MIRALFTPKINNTIRYIMKMMNSCNNRPIKYLDNNSLIFETEFKICSSCSSGKIFFDEIKNTTLSFKRKKVMKNTDANPIPRLLMVDKIELKKSVKIAKFILEAIFSGFKNFFPSIL